MRNRSIRRSSSCSDDDTPLITMLVNGNAGDPNSYDHLCKHSKETCEFCDRTFNNRYSSIVHNMRHIIIPLINQTTYQCDECLHHFTNYNDMILHRLKKHPHINKAQVTLVKTELQPTTATRQVTTVSKQVNTVPDSQTSEDTKNVLKAESLKDRLIFEEDVVQTCDRVLNDLTTDCKVNLETLNTPLKDPFEGRSVHYDELVKPGVFRCRRCGKGFPFRFDTIVHETSHMKLKNTKVTLCPLCNKYFLGNQNSLRLHYLTQHKEYPSENLHTNTQTDRQTNTQTDTQPNTQTDTQPNTQTDTQMNSQNVNIEKNVPKKVTFEHKERESAMQVNDTKNCAFRVSSKVLMLCELCFSFCKNKSFVSYERVSVLCEIGKRFRCEKCAAMFFEIILVKRQVRYRQGTDPKPKAVSRNEDRLKSIKNRFRMLKN